MGVILRADGTPFDPQSQLDNVVEWAWGQFMLERRLRSLEQSAPGDDTPRNALREAILKLAGVAVDIGDLDLGECLLAITFAADVGLEDTLAQLLNEWTITAGTQGAFPQKCRECGCDAQHACTGGCAWVEPDLCSACAQRSVDQFAPPPAM